MLTGQSVYYASMKNQVQSPSIHAKTYTSVIPVLVRDKDIRIPGALSSQTSQSVSCRFSGVFCQKLWWRKIEEDT